MYNRGIIKENRCMLIVNVILDVKFNVLIIIKKKSFLLNTSISIGVITANIQNIINPTIEQYLSDYVIFLRKSILFTNDNRFPNFPE